MRNLKRFRYFNIPVFFLVLAFVFEFSNNSYSQIEIVKSETVEKILNSVSSDNIEHIIKTLEGFGTRNVMSDTTSDTRGIGAARRWIYNEMHKYAKASGDRLKVYYQPFMVDRESYRRNQSFHVLMKNIIAELPGSNPALTDRLFVIMGHYDTVAFERGKSVDETSAPGANDDATGVAILMELARVMSNYEFDATIIFMAVDGEEYGLFGSSWYAQKAKEKNLRIDGVITNDIVGNIRGGSGDIDNTKICCYSQGPWDSPSRQLARYIRRAAIKYVDRMDVWNVFRNDRYGRGGDHTPFNIEGYAAVRFTEPNENYERQHNAHDVSEYVNIPYVTRVCKVTGAAFASLALAPEAPTEVTVSRSVIPAEGQERGQRGYNAVVRWKHPMKESDLAGFKVVARETTAPYYQYYFPVGKITEFEVKGMSIDHYSFGVLAVDKDNNESLVTVPPPLRPRSRQVFSDK